MRRFSLYKRGKYFYVQFLNEKTGKYMSGKSTGCTNRNEAIVCVLNWQKEPGHRVETDHRIAVDTNVQSIRSAALNGGDVKRIVAALNDIVGIPLNPATHSDVNPPLWEGLQTRVSQHRLLAGLWSI